VSSATPDDKSVPDWLDASHYQTIAARRFADFYRQTLHKSSESAAADSATNSHVIQEDAAQLILQRLDAFAQREKVDSVDQDAQEDQA